MIKTWQQFIAVCVLLDIPITQNIGREETIIAAKCPSSAAAKYLYGLIGKKLKPVLWDGMGQHSIDIFAY